MGSEFQFKSNLNNVLAALDQAAFDRMHQACIFMQNEVKKTLTGQRHGRRYIIPGLKTIKSRQEGMMLGKIYKKAASKGWAKTYASMDSMLSKKYKLSDAAKEKRKYTASAPGEAPAVRTGRLRNSIKFRVGGGEASPRGIVGTDVEYGPYLENGTKKMAKRPFIKPTFQKNRNNIKNILGGKWIP